MKRIITAMLTLALITGLSAEKASAWGYVEPGDGFRGIAVANSQTFVPSIPIAGVDRLIPLAGADSFQVGINVSKAIAAPQTYGLNPGGTSLMYEQGSRMHDSGEPIRDVDLPQTVNGVTVPYWNVLPPDAQDSFSHNLEW
jgi:hypothetical protein